MALRVAWPLRGAWPLLAFGLLCAEAADDAVGAANPSSLGGCTPDVAGLEFEELLDSEDESTVMNVQLMQTKRQVTKKAYQPSAERAEPNLLLSGHSREGHFRRASTYEPAREVARAAVDGDAVEAPDPMPLLQADLLQVSGEREASTASLGGVSDQAPDLSAEQPREPAAASTDLFGVGPPDPAPDGFELKGVAVLTGFNHDGDIHAFAYAVAANLFMCLTIFITFTFLRSSYKQIYANNVPGSFELRPFHDRPGCGWIWYAFHTDTERWTDMIGLDASMMIEFMDLCIRILLMVGIPILCIEGPLNYRYGGNAAGNDVLSYLSFANVDPGHPWLYYVHAGTVWFVIVVVQTNIYWAQDKFLKRRVAWLKGLPEERAHTILVDGIPPEERSEEKLRSFFEDMMGEGSVERVYVVKDTRDLVALEDQRTRTLGRIIEAERGESLAMEASNSTQAQLYGEEKKTLHDEHDRLLRECDKASRELWEKSRQKGDDGNPSSVNLASGFVKFKKRKTAQMALTISISSDSAEWALSTPPDSHDILWADLTCDPNTQAVWDAVGMALVIGLYFAYLPLVVGIANVATATDLGPLQPLWEGLAPTMGLQIMVSFLPTILLLIFRTCFALKANAWSQARLQNWYFWFQIVFVILVFAIGESVTEFTELIIADPTAIFGLLSETMPQATHFYMNFQVLQWTVHCLALLRFSPLWKFTGLRGHTDEEAVAASEPEDQGFHGIGSRCSRNTINMLIALIYGTICPPMNLLALLNFMICRFVYGYLVPFAETRKSDLGGVLWVRQLENLFIGLLIYSILMTGVLLGRSPTIFPMLITAPAIFYVLWSAERFETEFNWELLPFEEVAKGFKDDVKDGERALRSKSKNQYVQPGMERELEKQEAVVAAATAATAAATAEMMKKASSSEKRPKERDRVPEVRRPKDTNR